MAMKFYMIPVRDPAAVEAELNGFLGNHRVTTVERRFVDAGENSFWALCVEWSASAETKAGARERSGSIDYREVLPPEQFEIFARLRELRKKLAADEAVPVYAVFSNEQMAEMVRRGVRSEAKLREIDGVGDARMKKYGAAFLEVLAALPPGAEGSE